MEDLIYVGSRTNHRIDVMLAELLNNALYSIGVKTTTNINHKDIKVAIVFNGIEEKNDKVLSSLAEREIPVFYMVDDIDIPIPEYSNLKIVSQFTNIPAAIYFPIAELLVFHKLWDKPNYTIKCIDHFYGGTYKERRNYTPLNYLTESKLLVGDSKEWDKFNATRLGTIRDMDYLYDIMSMCKHTHIMYDQEHFGYGNTLRVYEAAMLGLTLTIWDKDSQIHSCIYPETTKLFINKTSVITKIKGLLWNIQQQM